MKLNSFLKCYNCLRNMNSYVTKEKVKNIGLEKETEELIKILGKYKKRNALIVGHPGIGKTALIENLASLINEGNVPKYLKDKTILELSMGGAISGTRYRGEFEEKIKGILEYITENKNIILFIDEAHTLSDAGKCEGAIKAGDIFKPYLARGDISVIGATTIKEYRETIGKDKALSRRFTILKMSEPNIKKTIKILIGIKNKYEEHYNIELNDNEIVNIVYSAKHLKGHFPDKALDKLEEYCYQKRELLEYNLFKEY